MPWCPAANHSLSFSGRKRPLHFKANSIASRTMRRAPSTLQARRSPFGMERLFCFSPFLLPPSPLVFRRFLALRYAAATARWVASQPACSAFHGLGAQVASLPPRASWRRHPTAAIGLDQGNPGTQRTVLNTRGKMFRGPCKGRLLKMRLGPREKC
jgi:hypothetical protein